MQLTPLSSGSKGNASLLSWDGHHILIDCGVRLKTIVTLLEEQGLEPTQLNAIIVTHEHGDHISGVAPLARKFNIATYISGGTYKFADKKGVPYRLFDVHTPFKIENLNITPFPIPHDAREACAFTFHKDGSEDGKMGYLTDCGHITPHIIDMLKGVKALALESNHCPELLEKGPYPYSLKKRVGGHYGHLSNQQAANLIEHIKDDVQKIRLMHLSEQNNCAEKAKNIIQQAALEHTEIIVAKQNEAVLPLTLS